jgi:hypothetical protein
VIEAPTDFMGQRGEFPGIMDLFPSAKAFRNHYLFMHEILGILWYQLRYLS